MNTLDAAKLAAAAQGIPPEIIDFLFKFGEDAVALMQVTIEEKRAHVIALKAAAIRDLGMVDPASSTKTYIADLLAGIEVDLAPEDDEEEPAPAADPPAAA